MYNFKFHSEISKNEDTLKEYMLYKQFLDSLTPQVTFFKLKYNVYQTFSFNFEQFMQKNRH